MKLLFFPSDLGGGFGHINRCQLLAKRAQAMGHDCAFVLNDDKYYYKIAEDFKVFYSNKRYILPFIFKTLKTAISKFHKPNYPLFLEFSSVDFQVIRDGLLSHDIIKMKINEYCTYVRTYKPDVLVGDMNFLTWIVSRMMSIPVVQIVRYISHPETARIIWWKDVPDDVISPRASELFNPLLKKYGLGTIDKIEDLFRGDVYLVPSIPEIEPIPADNKTFFTGAFINNDSINDYTPWHDIIDTERQLLYITIGGGAGPVGNKLLFERIAEALNGSDMKVIISTGGKFKPSYSLLKNDNIKIFDWLPGRLLISKADIVIFHGGYSTMMETIAYGKPSIIIPFHSEQEGNGRRLEQYGCGKVIKLCMRPGAAVTHNWKYGEYKYIIHNEFTLQSDELLNSIESIKKDVTYIQKCRTLMAMNMEYGGIDRAVSIIENFN